MRASRQCLQRLTPFEDTTREQHLFLLTAQVAMTQTMKELGETQKHTDASLKELAGSRKHTGGRLNIIIGIVMEGRKPGEVQ